MCRWRVSLFFGVLWIVLFCLWVVAFSQSPAKQMTMQGAPSTRRPWVVSKKMIVKMNLEPVYEKSYVTFMVSGEDGQMYPLDDVLAGILELHEHEK